jgi:hypothetical protein
MHTGITGITVLAVKSDLTQSRTAILIRRTKPWAKFPKAILREHLVKRCDANCQRTHFVARVDEKLTAFVELESAVRACGELPRQAG